MISLVVLITGLALPFHKNLKIKSLRIEAKVMLSHVAILESAYFTDSNKYVAFEDFYGAQMNGKENCSQPAGATELSFQLKRCAKDPEKGGLRYAYRIKEVTNDDGKVSGYIGEARSGSDITGESLVCLGTHSVDVWQIGPDKVLKHIKACD